MQISYFTTGGFVIHKAIDGKTSAWFGKDGNILDAEFRDRLGRSRPVNLGSPRWQRLITIGQREHAINARRVGLEVT